MMPQAAATSTSAPASPRRGTGIGPGGLRLIAALLLLAAPLAVAAWSIGNYSAQRERNTADTQLTNSVNMAGGKYGRLVSRADSKANRLANQRSLQLEFLRGGPRVLAWSLLPDLTHPHGRLER